MGCPSYDLYIYCNERPELPQVEILPETKKEMSKGENWAYKNYKITNWQAITRTARPAEPNEDITNKNYFNAYNAVYIREDKDISAFKMCLFDRIERTKEAEKRKEIENELINKYNITAHTALEIYEIIKANKKYFEA